MEYFRYPLWMMVCHGAPCRHGEKMGSVFDQLREQLLQPWPVRVLLLYKQKCELGTASLEPIHIIYGGSGQQGARFYGCTMQAMSKKLAQPTSHLHGKRGRSLVAPGG